MAPITMMRINDTVYYYIEDEKMFNLTWNFTKCSKDEKIKSMYLFTTSGLYIRSIERDENKTSFIIIRLINDTEKKTLDRLHAFISKYYKAIETHNLNDIHEIYNLYVQAEEVLEDVRFKMDYFIQPIILELKKLKKIYGSFSHNDNILSNVEDERYQWSIDSDEYITCFWGDDENGGYFNFPITFLLDPQCFEKWRESLLDRYREYKKNLVDIDIERKRLKIAEIDKEIAERYIIKQQLELEVNSK